MSGIEQFWAWWPSAKGRIEASIEGGGFEPALVSEIGEHVSAIDDGLDWELGPGHAARHAFCISACGDAEKRRITERWLRAAPAADATWEYHPARQGHRILAGQQLEIGGHTVELIRYFVKLTLDESKERVDITLFHPTFPEMEEQLRYTVSFLMLDGALGEDGVERWVGSIDLATTCPEDALPIPALEDAVESLAMNATGERFAILRGKDPEDNPIFVTVNRALKRIDFPLFDMHVTVDIQLLEPTDAGLTTNEEADELNAMEEALSQELGDSVAYFGRETRRGRRLLRFFAAELSRAGEVFERLKEEYPARDIQVTWTRDPSWRELQRYG
jgi:hypothetical protein